MVKPKDKISSLGDNWGAVLAEHWSDGELSSVAPPTPRGFPTQVPQFENQPEFEWVQRGARTPAARRNDYQTSRNSSTFTSLVANRRPGFGKKDIEQDVYLRRQDEENRTICRYNLIFIYSNYKFI